MLRLERTQRWERDSKEPRPFTPWEPLGDGRRHRTGEAGWTEHMAGVEDKSSCPTFRDPAVPIPKILTVLRR